MSTIPRMPGLAPNRLLVIDDQPDILEFLGQVAEQCGYAVALVESAERFQEQLTAFVPTLIIVDLQMPGVDGIELIRLLARRQVRSPVLIASGMDSRVLASAEQLGRSLGLKMAGVMQKPIMLGELEGMLETHLCNGPKVTEEDLRRAIDRAQLRVYYQPKTLRHNGGWRVTAAEALLRWEHPDHGMIYPDDFIPLAERSGLIAAMTDLVLQEGVRQVAEWSALGLDAGLTVNMSPKLIDDLEFPDRLAALLAAGGVGNSRLTLEVTETAALEEPARTLDILTRLRVKGIGLSLDDFGTGFSSLTQLYRMPFNEIKIDKSLGMEIQSSREARTIVRSIVDLAHNLELRVCCEGVESAQALDFLQSVGCDYAQGYFIGKPMPADKFARLAATWNQPSVAQARTA
jgi:EAL domain-containing protein (putative c-di-GMP-specific phosphodiesterase class I)